MGPFPTKGFIRIIKIPEVDDVPEEVCRGWLGIVLPYIDNKFFRDRSKNVYVPQKEAMEALEKYSPVTANWLKERGYPAVDGVFVFGGDKVLNAGDC